VSVATIALRAAGLSREVPRDRKHERRGPGAGPIRRSLSFDAVLRHRSLSEGCADYQLLSLSTLEATQVAFRAGKRPVD
jgi:hypothetical protein